MDNEKRYVTTLRLYKDEPIHREAYEYIRQYNTDIFESMSDFMAQAVVHYQKYLKSESESAEADEAYGYMMRHRQEYKELTMEAVMEAVRELESLLPKDAEQQKEVTGEEEFLQEGEELLEFYSSFAGFEEE